MTVYAVLRRRRQDEWNGIYSKLEDVQALGCAVHITLWMPLLFVGLFSGKFYLRRLRNSCCRSDARRCNGSFPCTSGLEASPLTLVLVFARARPLVDGTRWEKALSGSTNPSPRRQGYARTG